MTGGRTGRDSGTAAPGRPGPPRAHDERHGPAADTGAAPRSGAAGGPGRDDPGGPVRPAAGEPAPGAAGEFAPGPGGEPAAGGPDAPAAEEPRGLLARIGRRLAPAVRRRPGRGAPQRGPSRYRTAFYLLAGAGIVAIAAWLLLGSRFLVVRSVQVTGTRLVPKSEVLAAAAIPRGLPLIRLDTGAAASRIERISQVQSAQVSRQWPDGVLITIRERTPALAVPLVGGGFALVDPAGVVVQQVKAQPPGTPRFIPAGPLAGNPGVRAAAAVLRQLPRGIARRVTSVTVPTLDAVTLHLAGRVTIDWGTAGQSAQKARELAILMHTHAHYYDVSAPGTAVTG